MLAAAVRRVDPIRRKNAAPVIMTGAAPRMTPSTATSSKAQCRVTPMTTATSGHYRMAVGSDPALAATIDSMIAGEPFDAAQEKAAKDAGWR